MGLSRTVSEITAVSDEDRRISPLRILRPRWRGSPWNWVSALGYKKTRMTGLPGRERSLTISSALWIQSTNVTDGQTDGHRATAKTALTHSGKNDVVNAECEVFLAVRWRVARGNDARNRKDTHYTRHLVLRGVHYSVRLLIASLSTFFAAAEISLDDRMSIESCSPVM